MSRLTIDEKSHSGNLSQSWIDGVIYIFLRVNYRESDEELMTRISLTGPCELDLDVVSQYGSGPYNPVSSLSQIRDREGLRNFLDESTDGCFDLDLQRYLCEVNIEESRYEHNRSFSDITTFSDLDFYRGMEVGVSLFSSASVGDLFDTERF